VEWIARGVGEHLVEDVAADADGRHSGSLARKEA
jgi:hypothetical protein